MSKYLIVDGNAVLHRAYYALPDWRNRSGEATAGVYGFLSMLLKAIEELKPTHLIIVFDTPEPTFRHNMYVGYQSGREKERQVSEDIWGQVEKLKIVFEKMGVVVMTAPGFEADDVIGTIATEISSNLTPNPCLAGRRASPDSGEGNQRGEVIIITGDKDLMQLVTDKVKLYMPQKGLSDNVIIDEEKVMDKLGIKPDQVTDYKGLVGDSSDNYPGVSGIGPVTAKNLLGKYGTFEKIYKNINKSDNQSMPNAKSIIDKLVNGYESGELSKRLATIRKDVPLSISNVQCSIPNKAKMIEVFQELGYKSLVTRSGGLPARKASEGQGALF